MDEFSPAWEYSLHARIDEPRLEYHVNGEIRGYSRPGVHE